MLKGFDGVVEPFGGFGGCTAECIALSVGCHRYFSVALPARHPSGHRSLIGASTGTFVSILPRAGPAQRPCHGMARLLAVARDEN